MKSPEEIVGLLTERESTLEPGFARMRRVRAAYDGDIVVPLPELDQHEQVSVANLLAQGLDQTAMRVASVLPVPASSSTSSGLSPSESESLSSAWPKACRTALA